MFHTAPYRPLKKYASIAGFSLIEILTAIAIMSVLLAAAIPVFSNSSLNARQTSREIIKAHLQQARAHAISSGNATALAIPVIQTSSELGARAISLFEVEHDGDQYLAMTDPDTGQQRQLQRWQKLPGSFHFLTSSDASTTQPTILDYPARLETSYKGKNITCHLIVFSSSGQIIRPVGEVNLLIAPATRQGASLRLTERGSYELFSVNRLTGRTRPLRP